LITKSKIHSLQEYKKIWYAGENGNFTEVLTMSGHNKWSQIKHKKAKEDAKKGVAFTKLSKEITLAARQGGGDPNLNPKLRLLLEKAREANMPNDNTQRAILRGTGELPGMQYEEQSYEGYGPHGIAIIVDTLTDNKNRTVAELRRIFTKHEGNLAENGTVSWMFQTLGLIRVTKQTMSEEQLLEYLLDYEIHNLVSQEDEYIIYTAVKDFALVRQALEDQNIAILETKIEKVAQHHVSLDEAQSEKILSLLSTLQDYDDVQEVYTTLS
jgi:YebC/PmpR family DNA-binding regulatory protein